MQKRVQQEKKNACEIIHGMYIFQKAIYKSMSTEKPKGTLIWGLAASLLLHLSVEDECLGQERGIAGFGSQGEGSQSSIQPALTPLLREVRQ